MFKSKPFSINYLGNNGGYNFFVDIGNVNEIIYGSNLLTYLNPSPIGVSTFYNGVYDVLLNRVNSFGPVGNDGELARYLSPLKTSVTLSSSGSIYLRIPRIPMGSGQENTSIRPNWFASRTDFPNAINLLFWAEKYEIVTEVDSEDFVYNQRYDHLQSIDGTINFPTTKYPQKGAIYLKLADIIIDGDTVQIVPYFQSNVINPNRYVTMGINYLRNCSIYYFGFIHREETKISTLGYYSRPSWIIKTLDQIFDIAKYDIETDFGHYFNNWDYDFEGKADFFEIKQLLAVYSVYSNEKVRVRKLFEEMDEEESFVELNEDNLPIIFPGLDSTNTIIES